MTERNNKYGRGHCGFAASRNFRNSETTRETEHNEAFFRHRIAWFGRFEVRGQGHHDLPVALPRSLASVCFDLLILGEHFSIRRIGYFFKTECDDKGEKAWQNYAGRNRDKFFMYGANGFTVLTFIAAIYMLWKPQKSVSVLDVAWFIIVFAGFVYVSRRGRKALDRFDETKRKKSHED